MRSESTAKAERLAAEATRKALAGGRDDNKGRLWTGLSLLTVPGTVLISPVLFGAAGVLLALTGTVLAARGQRRWHGLALAAVITAGVVARLFETPVI